MLKYLKLWEEWEAPEEWESVNQSDIDSTGLAYQDLTQFLLAKLKNSPNDWQTDNPDFDLSIPPAVVKIRVSDRIIKAPQNWKIWKTTQWTLVPNESAIMLHNLDLVSRDPNEPVFKLYIISKYIKNLIGEEPDPGPRLALWQKVMNWMPSERDFRQLIEEFNKWAASDRLRSKNKTAPKGWSNDRLIYTKI